MLLRGRYFALLGCLAAIASSNRPAIADSQQTFITIVLDHGTAAGMLTGFRTSDAGASFVTCSLSGSSATCSQENTNSSQKNLGNLLCLPTANATTKISARCQSLINNGSGNCQANSSAGKCGSGTTAIMPVCNYRTSSNMATTANWVWNVAVLASGEYEIDCLNAGYSGYSQ
jgi:hypothetical protein